MSDYARDRLDLSDEDRLPWLEPANGYDDDDDGEGVSPLRMGLLILAGLVVLALVLSGVFAMRSLMRGNVVEGQVISAPADAIKVPASEADAKKFEGEGDASFAASEGLAREGRIDASRVPETPVASVGTAPAAETGRTAAMAAKPEARINAPVADATAMTRGTAGAVATTGGGRAMIQLGAYGNAAAAQDAWNKLARRFTYLAPLRPAVEQAKVGGATLHRLRAATSSVAEAGALCGKLKVAGESCLVVD